MRRTNLNRMASVGGVLLCAGLALGQNALGDGRALDRNTMQGGTGVNAPTRDYLSEFRFRNALVTGNVPGGAGFRGVSGYGLEYDFRQRVGSDDLFSFRRDSFTSGLAGAGIRGTEALQYQFALTVGNEPPRNLRGSLLTSRTGDRLPSAGFGAPTVIQEGATDLRPATREELGEYEPGTLLSLRSISAFTAGRSLGPSMLQMGEDQQGATQGLIASPLRGLAREALLGDSEVIEDVLPGLPGTTADAEEAGDGDEPVDRFGRFPSARIDITTDVRDRLSTDFESRVPEFTPSGVARPDPDAGAGEDPAEPVRETPTGAMGERAPFMARLAELQQALREGVVVDAEGSPADGSGPAEVTGMGAVPPSQQILEERIQGWDQLVTTLKTGVGTIEVPTPRLDRASAYDLHIERAQEMMQGGRYFEAEQRFTMALAARPGDAIAAIGRIHAQIGAGLDLSASVNLRAFLVEHPEFVAARYEPDMLPTEDRMESAARRLRSQLDETDGAAQQRETALLLAYVSFHGDDLVSVALGLERLAEGRAGRRDALVPLLQAVWQDEDTRPGSDGGTDSDSESDSGSDEDSDDR